MTEDIKLSIAVIVGTLLILVGIVGVAKILDKTSDVPITQTTGDRRNVKGNTDASNVVVEFSDFECPACALAYSTVDQIIADYSDLVSVEFRHFPLPQHTKALQAAYAAEAAGAQDKFWEAHDYLFSHQTVWENEDVSADYFYSLFGDSLGLEKDQFVSDYSSDTTKNNVEKDIQAANNLRINSTPTFYINGKQHVGVLQYQDWVDLLDLPERSAPIETPTEVPTPEE